MHFDLVHYLDDASDSTGERSGQLLLMKRGHSSPQDDGASDHFNIDQPQYGQTGVIDGKSHPPDQPFGICELGIGRIFKRVHASFFLLNRSLQRKSRTGFS